MTDRERKFKIIRLSNFLPLSETEPAWTVHVSYALSFRNFRSCGRADRRPLWWHVSIRRITPFLLATGRNKWGRKKKSTKERRDGLKPLELHSACDWKQNILEPWRDRVNFFVNHTSKIFLALHLIRYFPSEICELLHQSSKKMSHFLNGWRVPSCCLQKQFTLVLL